MVNYIKHFLLTIYLKLEGSNPLFYMSTHKSKNIIKNSVIKLIAAIVLIAISLIPISRKSAYWNRLLHKTLHWIKEKENDLKHWDKKAKEILAVAICNETVFEPKFLMIK